MLIFSSPKEIVPPKSVIFPEERVIVPSIDASSATVKSSVEVNCSAETIPEAVKSPVIVCEPDASVPLVLIFSSPKEIAPPESVILPVERVIVPSIDASSETVKSSVEVNCSAETVPLEAIVKSFATYESVTSVPCQVPEEIVPTASIELSFEVVITVPVTSGKVIVLSAVGSDRDKVVSKSLSDSPSNTSGVDPEMTPKDVA